MRGKEKWLMKSGNAKGITPAYAGKRRKTGHQNHDAEDHPRVCGEKEPSADSLILTSGSPPRMRGKAKKERAKVKLERITPAYAGKRSAA